MLTLEIPELEGCNEKTREFVSTKACTLHLEHSLIALSKWESKWHKIFLDGEPKPEKEMRDYLKCMCLDKDVDPVIWDLLPMNKVAEVFEYIDDPMTGTRFRKNDENEEPSRELMSSELMYYYMFSNSIPKECEKWHLNRLLTLLRIFGEKNKVSDKPKASQSQLLNKYASRHAARKKAKK